MKSYIILYTALALCLWVAGCKPHQKILSTSTDNPLTDSLPWYPLETSSGIDILLRDIGDAKIVLLGESTHGTHEFYSWRSEITKRLINEKGFTIVAVEGDWTDTYRINEKIKGPVMNSDELENALKGYDRWPGSLWGNYDMLAFLLWVNQYNNEHKNTISYYGLDLYSFWEWATEAHLYAGKFFSKYGNDAQLYAADPGAYPEGKRIAENLFDSIMKKYGSKLPETEDHLKVYQQAWLFLEGDRFFRTMKTDRVTAVNTRDRFMAQTIERLLEFYGPNAKIVAWIHNTHAGDAHYSSTHNSGYTSAAEILKTDLGKENIYTVGFGTYKGKVLAGYRWNAPLTEQIVLPAKTNTWEEILHRQDHFNKLILSKNILDKPRWDKWIEFRSIGASFDGAAVYSQSIIPRRFNAFIFIDSTTAINPVK